MRSQIAIMFSVAALCALLPGVPAGAESSCKPDAACAGGVSAPMLAQTVFPATGTHETIITIPSFGRYAISVSSAQGTALQLVDRMAGPGNVSGAPGAQDGRIDAFLERGTYKLRLISDARGTGNATVSVVKFTELQSAPVQLVEDKPVIADLGDGQQRSWWIVVKTRGTYSFEAGGRYLNELRLWQPGSWMVNATPVVAEADGNPDQPLALRQLVAQLEPGIYQLTAYGGPGLPWAQDSKAAPFMLRWGVPALSDSGRSLHQASVLGIDRFLVPGTASTLRLVLDKAAPASIAAQPYDPSSMFDQSEAMVATIDKHSRDPVVELGLPKPYQHDNAVPWLITVTRMPGASYRLEALNAGGTQTTLQLNEGNTLLAVTLPGDPDDEIDPGFFLIQNDGQRMVASSAIELDTALPWRRSFNLLDTAQTFLHTSQSINLVVSGSGVPADFVVDRFMVNPPDDRRVPDPKPSGGVWTLTPGYYVLSAIPQQNGHGVLTMSMTAQGGPAPGADSPRLPAALFKDLSVNAPDEELGAENINETGYGPWSFTLFSAGGGASFGLRQMDLPATLTQPLSFELGAGQSVNIPISIAADGELAVTGEDGAGLGFTLDGKAVSGTVTLHPGQYEFAMTGLKTGTRMVNLAETPASLLPATALPVMAPAQIAPAALPPVRPGEPDFLDFAQGQNVNFALPVDHDALYRFETTGLLETGGTIRTHINPSLGTAEGNGTGRNFLLQMFLREGDYQLAVQPQGQTAGHAGVALTETPLLDEGVLAPGNPARITLEPGQAALYHFHIAAQGAYHLFTLGLGHAFNMRLEDADGWPLLAPGGAADAQLDLAPGDYRMILLPGLVENRAVTMLQQILPPPVYAGHGPFQVAFGQDMQNRWMEPAPGAKRVPDIWSFDLPAAATVTVTINAGMRAQVFGAVPGAAAFGTTDGGSWTGRLAAGAYAIATMSAAQNNRVDYTLNVSLKDLTPGQSEQVTAPAVIPVSLGGAQQYEISSFGGQDVRASLYDAAGKLVAANDDRDNDWNFLIAGNFAPGTYTLHVDPVGTDNAQTLVSIASPAIIAGPALAVGTAANISDGQVHAMDVPAPPPGSLMLLGATAAVPVGLALEAQQPGGDWRMLTSTTGLNPYLAMPAGCEKYRLRAWAEDHGTTPVAVSVQFVTGPAADIAALSTGLALAPVSLGARQLGVVRINIPQPQVLQLAGGADTLQWSAAADVPAAHDLSGAMLATGASLWLVDATAHTVAARPVDLLQAKLRMNLPEGQSLTLPLPPQQQAALWQVMGQGGQPGVSIIDGNTAPVMALGGRLGALSQAIAFQPAGMAGAKLRLWQAGSPVDPLPLIVQRTGFAAPGVLTLAIGGNDGTLPAHATLQGSLPAGWKRLSIDLPAGAVAVLSHNGATANLIVGDGMAPDVLDSDADSLLLLNPGSAAAPYSVSFQAEAAPQLIMPPDGLLTYYSATPANLHVIVGRQGAVVKIAGAATNIAGIDADGIVTGGNTARIGFGGALVTVQPGLSVISEDGIPTNMLGQLVAVPGSVQLTGQHMLLQFAPAEARLVHFETNTPVVVLGSNGPQLFPAGATLNLFQPKGTAQALLVQAVTSAGLSGTARFDVIPAIPITDGLGAAVRVAPGQSRLFTFSLSAARSIGVGVRGSVDDANCRLLAADGTALAHGVVAMKQLPAGTYFLAVDVPADGAATDIQPALVGMTLPDDGPPPDVQASYRALAGQPQGN